ncbi:glycosyltransferase [Candidatus Woesearchaeota archaeon]|nr:glycosyltransferase [Candidatus Woesearchaeota archaeon]
MGVKVAHFISTSGLYGAERWILALLSSIKKVSTLLICTNYDDLTLFGEAKKQGIKTKLLSTKGNYAVFDSVKKLSRLLKEEQIDILHTHGYKSDIIGLFAAKKAKIKVISTPHGWSKYADPKLKTYELLDRFFLIFFDLVCPHTKQLNKSLNYIKRKKLVNNFVDLKTIPKPKKGDPRLITYIGQLIPRKRVQDLIISLGYVKDKSTRLQIIGNGPKKDKLMKLANNLGLSSRIDFLGYREDRLDLLNNSKIFILPSTLEYIPRVLMEAMALERVVITSDIRGNKPLIKNNETGMLVPVKNPRKIAEAVDHVQNNPEQAEKIAENAKNLIKSKFSAERAAREYEKIYSSLK